MKTVPTDAEVVGQRIFQERTSAELTQVALAEVTGIPQTTISGYERGAEVSLRNAALIAAALGISLNELAAAALGISPEELVELVALFTRPSGRRRPQLQAAS